MRLVNGLRGDHKELLGCTTRHGLYWLCLKRADQIPAKDIIRAVGRASIGRMSIPKVPQGRGVVILLCSPQLPWPTV